ncbi:LamG domain-containing protein [Nonomuraea sp. NPDC050663]|uniref:LamG domain-containing protein n=1 Tax=Nonomuraea sp. NPDC050663 TaxID=3364370 RepID=UPI0037A29821
MASTANTVVLDPRDPASRALAEARATGQRVAVKAEQTESRDVFAHPDGTFKAELHTTPVRVRSGAAWIPVDTTLRQQADGTVGPVATTVSIAFSGGGKEPLVRLSDGKNRLTLGWPAPLPAPRLDKNTATYPNVFPGVDLRLSAEAQGFSKVFVVKDRAAAAHPALQELSFPVSTAGISLSADKHGNVDAVDAAGKSVFRAGAPMMWDSTPETPRQAVGSLRLDGDRLLLRPDPELLRDPQAIYPLHIDPGFAAGRIGWAIVLSGHPNQAYWGGDGDRVGKVGHCDWPGCNGIGTARSYFVFNTEFLNDRHILEAEFNAFENYAPSCQHARLVQAYSTRPAGTGTTWNNMPEVHGLIGEHNVARGYDSNCPGAWLGFNAMRAVTDARSNGGRATIMLRSGNSPPSEADPWGWKKFGTSPTLSVTYNTRPGTPTAQQVDFKACGVGANAVHLNPFIDNDPNKGPRGPGFSTVITDAEGSTAAQFEWYRTGTTTLLGRAEVGTKGSGARFSMETPAAQAPHGAKISFRGRGFNNNPGFDRTWGDWGAMCDVVIDREGPDKKPTVTSTAHPECPVDDYDSCPVSGGVGRTASFTFDANGVSDVAGFRFDLMNNQPQRYVTASGGTATGLVTLPDDGFMDLYVRSVDKAGNEGPLYTYHFRVGPGSPPKGQWRLNGISEVQAVDDSRNNHNGSIPAAATDWRQGRHGDALWFNGTSGHVHTEGGPTVQTSRSFAVSAWVNIDRLDSQYRTAVSQDGRQISAFFLRYNPNTKKWNFLTTATDSVNGTGRVAESAQLAVAGRWTHVVGMHDAATKQVKIYVDGIPGTVASHTTPWDATGSVQLGRALIGTPKEYWPGALDEIRLYDRTLSVEEIHDLASLPATEELFLPLDEGSGSTASEVSGNYRIGTLQSGASWTEGRVGTGAVRLSGTTATLSTTGPATRTDASFTVSAWAKLDAASTAWQTVLSQDGTQASGFQLRYRGDRKQWSFALPQSDTPDYDTISVEPDENTLANEGEWTHLAGVYDQAAKTISLYINGARVAEKANVQATWNAPGALQIGRGKQRGTHNHPFAGAIDDVHVWSGIRTREQIRDVDYPNELTARTTVHADQLGRFVNVGDYHIVTTGPVPAGSHFEGSLGVPAPAGAENTATWYSCRIGNSNDYFLAHSCGTYVNLGSIGSYYTSPPEGIESLAVYRCKIGNKSHFASTDPLCENQTAEGRLGYTRAYQSLIRYVSTYASDHSSSSYRMPGHYRAEGNLGLLSMRPIAGTTALMNCQDGNDMFTSVDAACEGKTMVRRLGYIWSAAPQDGPRGVELFRCRTASGERFDSLDPGCEGQAVDRSLGFLAAALDPDLTAPESGRGAS